MTSAPCYVSTPAAINLSWLGHGTPLVSAAGVYIARQETLDAVIAHAAGLGVTLHVSSSPPDGFAGAVEPGLIPDLYERLRALESTTAPEQPYDPLSWTYGEYGDYMPDATHSGLQGIGLTPDDLTVDDTSGVLVVEEPDTYLHHVWFQRDVRVAAPGVKFAACLFSGTRTRTSNSGLLNVGSAADTLPSDAVYCDVYDCDFDPLLPSLWWDAFRGHHARLHRCRSSRTVDSFGIQNMNADRGPADVHVLGHFSSDFSYFSPDPTHANDTPVSKVHGDVFQWYGGRGLTVTGNNFQGFCDPDVGDITYSAEEPNPNGGGPNNHAAGVGWNVNYPHLNISGAVLQVNANLAGQTVGGLNFRRNWVSGAYRHVTLSNPAGGSYEANLGEWVDNIHGRDTVEILNKPGTTTVGNLNGHAMTRERNVFADDGSPVSWNL